MIANANQIMIGIVEYVRNDVIRQIPDVNLKLIVGTMMYAAVNRSDNIIRIIDSNSIVSAFKFDDGYDVDALSDSLKRSITEYGSISVTIPSIPLISKAEKTISFGVDDVDRLRQRILDAR